MIRRLLAVLAVAAALAAAPAVAAREGPAGDAEPAAEPAGPVLVVELRGPLMPITADYLERAVAEAAAMEAGLVLLELDTPGGLVTAVRRMVTTILESPIPVAVYVGPSGAMAASGGAFLVLAADVTLMAPVSDVGAAHPVMPGGANSPEDISLTKAASELAAFARSLAEHRGRDPGLAEEMVRESRSYGAREALAAGLVGGLAESREQALEWLHGRVVRRPDGQEVTLSVAGAERRTLPRNVKERVLGVLSEPLVAFFLLALGLLGIYAEIMNPGTLLPAAVGIVCLLLFALASQVLPVNWVGAGLLGLGLALLVLEVKVVSYGALTAGGLACLVVGGLVLFDVPPALRVSRALLASLSLAIGLIAVFLLRLAIRAQRQPPAMGAAALVGLEGEALTRLEPGGKVTVRGEVYDAVCTATLERGRAVVVTGVEGRRLRVRPGPEPLGG